MVVVWCERGFFHAHICLCEEKVVPSELPVMTILISLYSNELHTIPPKLHSLNIANTHFFHIKIHFFLKKFALFMRDVPLHSANHLYLRTPPVGNHSYLAMHRTNFPTFPRSYVRLMQPIRTFFIQKYIFS